MTVEEKKALLLRFYDMFRGDSTIEPGDICSESYNDHMPHPGPEGLDALRATVRLFRSAFPDAVTEVEVVMCDGHMVAGSQVFRGTHTGWLMDIAPTGRPVEFHTMDIVRIDEEEGKIAEIWHLEDNLKLNIQLGVIDPPG